MNVTLKDRIESSEDSVLNNTMRTEIRHYLKLILMGNVAVGKTSILSQFIDEAFDNKYKCTLSADYKVKSILIDDNAWVEMYIWDTCGSEKFRSFTRLYYKNAKGCVLAFDLTDRKSFNDLEQWIDDLKEFGDEDMTVVIVGNKADLEKDRVIDFQEGSEFAKKFQFDYVEVSAKTGMNVNILFEILCKSYIKKSEINELKKMRRRDRSNVYYMEKSVNKGWNSKEGGCCGN